MADTEVEEILDEIRARVRAEQQQLEVDSRRANADANNGDVLTTSTGEPAAPIAEALARVEAYLTTTGRAWDQLPPLVSNRSGALARMELWIKRRFKSATRWYAWEQINFNAAVHHALRDTLTALAAVAQLLTELDAEVKARSKDFERDEIERQAQRAQLELQRKRIDSQQANIEAQARDIKLQQIRSSEVQTQLLDLVKELRDRDGRLLEEQRVCLKQLALEISEARTLLDRVRRGTESRLDKLETEKRTE